MNYNQQNTMNYNQRTMNYSSTMNYNQQVL